ncbi:MFS transporter [Asanoa sp. WMMD1127]|uniref:MFS transporter n=1 Tax=Asanoa sp. WMMD1127 TaxID=3016107 RepID=UPI002417A316|nr:MFS transporter [Asanoa sp. WMMD1127]MDG4825557.1 MFS transporter [Asanoa sp. WMMD1127]
MTRQGPFAGHYPAVAAMVVLALIPYLVLSAALEPVMPVLQQQLGMSTEEINLATGLANAGYALGTVLSVQLAQHLPQRRMLIVYAVVLVIGSVLAAAAVGPVTFIAGHVLQGLCTSLLLIAAVPPLVTGFPPAKVRYTAVVLNLSIFGAVALGPLIGGIQADANGWRPMFWVIAAIAMVALLLVLATYRYAPPADPTSTKAPTAVLMAAAGCIAAFYGAAQLLTHQDLNAATLAPLIAGVALILVLLVQQYRARRPLLVLRPLTTTLPVAGIIAAMSAAAASVSAITLTGILLTDRYSPLKLGLIYLPEFGGAVLTAILFAVLFASRGLHFFALGGLLSLTAGIALIATSLPPSTIVALVGTALIGLGVGASVAPSLFIAGFSLRNTNLQRVFAIIELLRAVAAFMIAPILVYIALTVGATQQAGIRTALWIALGIAGAGTLAAISLYLTGGVRRPPTPSLAKWFGGEDAWYSPPLLAAFRRNVGKEAPEHVGV